jgi:hypothetical protein
MRALLAIAVAVVACMVAAAGDAGAEGDAPAASAAPAPDARAPAPPSDVAPDAGAPRDETAPPHAARGAHRKRHPDYDAALEQGDYGRALQGAFQDMREAGEDADDFDEALDRFNQAGQLELEERRRQIDQLDE